MAVGVLGARQQLFGEGHLRRLGVGDGDHRGVQLGVDAAQRTVELGHRLVDARYPLDVLGHLRSCPDVSQGAVAGPARWQDHVGGYVECVLDAPVVSRPGHPGPYFLGHAPAGQRPALHLVAPATRVGQLVHLLGGLGPPSHALRGLGADLVVALVLVHVHVVTTILVLVLILEPGLEPGPVGDSNALVDPEQVALALVLLLLGQ